MQQLAKNASFIHLGSWLRMSMLFVFMERRGRSSTTSVSLRISIFGIFHFPSEPPQDLRHLHVLELYPIYIWMRMMRMKILILTHTKWSPSSISFCEIEVRMIRVMESKKVERPKFFPTSLLYTEKQLSKCVWAKRELTKTVSSQSRTPNCGHHGPALNLLITPAHQHQHQHQYPNQAKPNQNQAKQLPRYQNTDDGNPPGRTTDENWI